MNAINFLCCDCYQSIELVLIFFVGTSNSFFRYYFLFFACFFFVFFFSTPNIACPNIMQDKWSLLGVVYIVTTNYITLNL